MNSLHSSSRMQRKLNAFKKQAPSPVFSKEEDDDLKKVVQKYE